MSIKSLESIFSRPALGLLIIRLGVGVIFIIHGWPKLMGGPDMWRGLGSTLGQFGIDFFPVFWGLMAALTEVVGGLLIAVGLWFRPAAFLLLGVMIVATLKLVGDGADFGPGISHPLKMAFVFLGLLFTGAGAYSLQRR